MMAIIMAIEDDDDREFVEKIFDRYEKNMYFTAYDILRNRADAEDCVQEMCIRDSDNQPGTAYFDDIAFCYVGTDSKVTEYKYNDAGMPEQIRSGYSYTWYKYDGNNNVTEAVTRRSATEYSYTGNRLTEKTVYNYIADTEKPHGGYSANAARTLVSTTTYEYNLSLIHIWERKFPKRKTEN